jgi:hypothetical protein
VPACSLLLPLALAEDLEAEDLSEIEDFIVHKPDRDYASFYADHFPFMRQEGSDDDDDEEEEEEEGEGEDGEGYGEGKDLGAGRQGQGEQHTEVGGDAVLTATAATAAARGAAGGEPGTVQRRGRPRKPPQQQVQRPKSREQAAGGRAEQQQEEGGSQGVRGASQTRGPAAEAKRRSARAAGGAAAQPSQPPQPPQQQQQQQQQQQRWEVEGQHCQPGSAAAPPEAGGIWRRLQQLVPGLGAATGGCGQGPTAGPAAGPAAATTRATMAIHLERDEGGGAWPCGPEDGWAMEAGSAGERAQRGRHEARGAEASKAPLRRQQRTPARSRAGSRGSSRRSGAAAGGRQQERRSDDGPVAGQLQSGGAGGAEAEPEAPKLEKGRRTRR